MQNRPALLSFRAAGSCGFGGFKQSAPYFGMSWLADNDPIKLVFAEQAKAACTAFKLDRVQILKGGFTPAKIAEFPEAMCCKLMC